MPKRSLPPGHWYRPEPMSVWSWFLLIFGSLWNWFSAWEVTAGGKRSAPIFEVLGAWIVYTLFIGAISLLAKPAGWGRVARWYFWLSLIVSVLVFYRMPRHNALRP